MHDLSPLVLDGDAHDRHATCGSVIRASRFLTGLVTTPSPALHQMGGSRRSSRRRTAFCSWTKFHASFAADVPADLAGFMAELQVPWGVDALGGLVTDPVFMPLIADALPAHSVFRLFVIPLSA
jgi:hypothetical protein